jgi:hypothetical protein
MCVGAAVLLLTSAGGWQCARSATFPDLYTLTVMPDAAAGDRRTAAMQTAMRDLLERVTGDRGAPLDPDLQDMVQDAASYLGSYATLGGDRDQVGFIESKVDQALESRGRRVWGAERPLTLLWIAVDGGGGNRALLSADDSDAALAPDMLPLMQSIRMQVTDVASERGLPVVLPLLDLEDLAGIGFADVWGGFDERIEQASQRYRADAVLVGRVLVTELGADIQWTLLRGTERRASSGESVAEGLQWLADQYAAEYGVVGGMRTLRLVVQDVETVDDYGRVMSYLDGLSSLQTVDVDSLADGVLTLHVASRGDADVLAKTFSLGRVLEAASAPGPASPQGAAGGTENSLVLRVERSGSSR